LAASPQGSTLLPEQDIEAPGHTIPPPPVLLDEPLDALLPPPTPPLDTLLLPPPTPPLDALLLPPPTPPLDALLLPSPPAPPPPPVDDVLAGEPLVDALDAPPPLPPPPLPCEVTHPTAPTAIPTTSAVRELTFDMFQVLPGIESHARPRARGISRASLADGGSFFDAASRISGAGGAARRNCCPISAIHPPRSVAGGPTKAIHPPRSVAGAPMSAIHPPRSVAGAPTKAIHPPRSVPGAPGALIDSSLDPSGAAALPGAALDARLAPPVG
jgi:hypothetical protein